jgi:hypothetical protein
MRALRLGKLTVSLLPDSFDDPKFAQDSSALFQRACQMVERARASPANAHMFLEAAKGHRLAAEAIRRELAEMPTGDAKVVALVFPAYYEYEAYRCDRVYQYELRNTTAAIAAGEKSQTFLDEAIQRAKEAAATVSGQLHDKAVGFVTDFEYRKTCDEAAMAAIHARRAWDDGNLVSARDWYQRVTQLQTEAVDRAKKLPDPIYYRIALGNQIASSANEANALARHFVSVGHKSRHSKQVFMIVLKSLLDGLTHGLAAFRTNPEWTQYQEGSAASRAAMKQLLALNPWVWSDVVLEFPGEGTILTLMQEIDPRRAESVRVGSSNNRVAMLWRTGSFFLLVFVVVVFAALAVATSLSLWGAVLAIVFAETALLILGAFALRATGDMSEKSTVKLLDLAIKSQFSVIGQLIERKHKPPNGHSRN